MLGEDLQWLLRVPRRSSCLQISPPKGFHSANRAYFALNQATPFLHRIDSQKRLSSITVIGIVNRALVLLLIVTFFIYKSDIKEFVFFVTFVTVDICSFRTYWLYFAPSSFVIFVASVINESYYGSIVISNTTFNLCYLCLMKTVVFLVAVVRRS